MAMIRRGIIIMARGSRNIKIELEQVQIEGIVEQSIIDNCSSPQCKEYMINKNKEYARRKIYKAFDEAIRTRILPSKRTDYRIRK